MLSKRQLALRRNAIGASEIAALAGLSKWSGPIEVFESKVCGGLGAAYAIETPEESYAMELGTEMEAPIARVWARRHGRALRLVDTLQHPTKPYAIATPDRAVFQPDEVKMIHPRVLLGTCEGAECILQVKSTNWRMAKEWGDEGTDQIPVDYLCQAHWEGSVAGADVVRFAVDFDKTRLAEYEVRVSAEAFGRLYEIAERFMVDHVIPKRPPPPDASEAYAAYLGRAFPREESDRLVKVEPGSDPELESTILQYLMLREAGKRLGQWKDHCYNWITARMGPTAGLVGDFGKLTWKRSQDSVKVDWQATAQEALATAQLAVNTLPDSADRRKLIAAIESTVARHTEIRPGFRSLRAYPSREVVETNGLERPFEVALDPYVPTKKPKAHKQITST